MENNMKVILIAAMAILIGGTASYAKHSKNQHHKAITGKVNPHFPALMQNSAGCEAKWNFAPKNSKGEGQHGTLGMTGKMMYGYLPKDQWMSACKDKSVIYN
jgi:hypothetical protein